MSCAEFWSIDQTAVKNDALDGASYYFDSGEDLQGHLRLKVKVKNSAHTKFLSYHILLLSPTPSATISQLLQWYIWELLLSQSERTTFIADPHYLVWRVSGISPLDTSVSRDT